ncbi:MAG: glutamate--tRNA ligase [Bacillota bacterium]|nr:glutamate--tRNA ligase [Bacillota bacterium]
MEKIRVRFAPSPTGPLHIGGARSALFNYLLAKQYRGTFVVRIEDTDLERSNRESEENILASLKWLGMDWDEGIQKGGDKGPYRQTERLDIYKKYVDLLLENGQAYFCYCTEEELEEEREALKAKGETPRYLGKCRTLTEIERKEMGNRGLKPVVRFRVPDGQIINIDDLVRGKVSFESDGIGDYVIVKSDGIPTYNFAVVIDDATMDITHVIRGEEHLSNTPRQVLIYEALGLAMPSFAHISLILGKDRSKMSKRHGSTSVVAYKDKGYLPEALINFLALLGWSPVGEEEIFTIDDLIKQFSLDRVAKNPAVFDLDKLNHINSHYIRKAPLEEITTIAIPFLSESGYVSKEPNIEEFKLLTKIVAAVRERINNVAEVANFADIFFSQEVIFENEEAKEVLKEEQVPQVLELLQQKVMEAEELTAEVIKALLKSLTKELGLGGRKVFMPVRVALTGQMHGPELYDIIPILGKEGVKKRIASSTGQLS